MRFDSCKCVKIYSRPEFCPGPHCGSLQRCPDPLAGFGEGEGRVGGGKKEKTRGEERKEGDGKGRSEPQVKILAKPLHVL